MAYPLFKEPSLVFVFVYLYANFASIPIWESHRDTRLLQSVITTDIKTLVQRLTGLMVGAWSHPPQNTTDSQTTEISFPS